MNRKYKSAFLWGGIIIVILGIGYGMIWLVSSLSGVNDEIIPIQISSNDFSKGKSDAEIVLVEYSDFQCPACAAWQTVLKQLEVDKDIKDQLRIIYRFFPLSQIHKNASLASESAYAAGKQNKFWEYHDILFEKQEEWSDLSASSARDKFILYAQTIGIAKDKFISDTDSIEAKKAVQDSYNKGLKFGVDSTPTFFVNGMRLRNITNYEGLKSILISSRATQTPK